MSYSDSAQKVLDRAEASLKSLMSDARKAKAYEQMTAIEALTKSVVAIRTKGARLAREVSEGGKTTGRPERRAGRVRRAAEPRRKERRSPPRGIEGRKGERRAARDRRGR